MKNQPDLALLPGAQGSGMWRIRARSGKTEVESSQKKAPGWVGLPTREVVSVPMKMATEDREQCEGAIELELEAAGLAGDEMDSHRYDLCPAESVDHGGASAVFVTDGGFPENAELSKALDAQFAPAVLFRSLRPGVLSIWRESGGWVLAVPSGEGKPVHAQGLSAHDLDADAAAEILCILGSLEIQDLLPKLREISVEVEEEGLEPEESFREAVGMPVEVVQPAPVKLPDQPVRLMPDEVVQARQQRKQLRVMAVTITSLVLIISAALSAFAARLYVRDEYVSDRMSELDAMEGDLQEIRDAQQIWDALNLAINPDEFAVEQFYQLVNILPEQGIRVTRFQQEQDSLIIDGEASSVNHAISFRGDLTSSGYYSDWGFGQGFVQNGLPDGRATFRAEGRRPGTANGEAEGLVQ